MAVEVGAGYVTVLPDFSQVHKRTAAGLTAPLVNASTAAGRQAGAALATTVAAPLAARRGPVRRALDATGRAAGRSFTWMGRNLQQGMTSAWSTARSDAQASIDAMGSSFATMAKQAGTLVAGIGLYQMGRAAWQTATDVQQASAALEGLYGSADEAATVMERIRRMGRESPIEAAAFRQGAQDLAYLGLSGDETVGVLRQINTALVASGGSQEQMNSTTQAMLAMANQGKATADTLNQASQAGMPVWSMLADHMGLSIEKARKRVEDGMVGIEDVIAAIEAGGGDSFAQMQASAEATASTFASSWRRAKDNVIESIGAMLVPLTTQLAPVVNRAGQTISRALGGLPGLFRRIGQILVSTGITDAFARLVNGARAFGRAAMPAFTAAGQVLSTVFLPALTGVLLALGPVGDALKATARWMGENTILVKTLGAVLGGLTAAWIAKRVAMTALTVVARGYIVVQRLLNAVMSANPIARIITLLAGLAAGLIYAYKNSKTFRKIVDRAFTMVRKVVGTVLSFIADLTVRVFGNIVTTVQRNTDRVVSLFRAGLRIATGIWEWAGNFIERLVDGLFDNWLTRFFARQMKSYATLFDVGWDRATRIWRNALDWAREKVGNVLDGIEGAFRRSIRFIGRIWGGIKDKVRAPVRSLLRWINRHLIGNLNKVTKKFGLEIPRIKMARGGMVRGPGGPTADRIPAQLSAGEYVVRAKAVQKYGAGFFDDLNRQRYASGGLVTWRGHTFTDAMRRRLINAERLAGSAFSITQGGFRPRTSYSGTTHGRDAVDIAHPTMRKVVALRRSAIAAWDRTGKGNWMPHIHGVPLPGGGVQLSSSAAGQVRAYHRGGDGLGGRDNGPGVLGTVGNWFLRGASWLMKQAVKPLRALVNRIPGDGWVPSFVRGTMREFLDSAVSWAHDKDEAFGGNGSSGASQRIARSMLAGFGWGANQWNALRRLWHGESSWNHLARNPSSGAYGIPQALPGSKMASAGPDWRTNPATQIRWGLNYIRDRYGSPAGAYAAWLRRSPHWYDAGGVLPPGAHVAVNSTGKPEAVLTHRQWRTLEAVANRGAAVPNIRVFIGNRELTELVRVELDDHDHRVARAVKAGRRP